ncbi:MAG: hypothetical protein JWQ50_3228 [Caballeronia mineralivorans]|jgi:hypothetical protein|nr:hypothetical protein [Caballeronia mineralivorans]
MNRSWIPGTLSAWQNSACRLAPLCAEYEHLTTSLTVIKVLQPGFLSGLLRTKEVLIDLLPGNSLRCSCIASGHIRHAADVLSRLRGFHGCSLFLRPCVSNDEGGCACHHDSKRLHVECSIKEGRTRSADRWPKKAIPSGSTLVRCAVRIASAHVATPFHGTPSTQDEEIVNVLRIADAMRVGRNVKELGTLTICAWSAKP